ncbi:MAG: alpha/beta fold hydrolase [Solirubrobacteraceae bacterium]|nr:alpha/beta fold hydrolase [Solirubrobacteraceae bacterium]
MPARRLLPLLLSAVMASLAAMPAAARADIPWAGCLAANYQCGKLRVPLDRSGAVPGSVSISVTRKVARSNPTRTAIVAFAGGPGQAAQPFARSFATLLSAGLADKDLLVFDQRGTGKSDALSCGALKRRGSIDRLIGACSNELGPRRAFYTSADTVKDLEALRIEGGYDRLILYGVSYGTKVALAYAATHPTTVQSLILDSTVLPEGPDALRRGSAGAVTRVLGEDLCENGACDAATPNALTDLRLLAARVARTPMRASVYSGDGRRFTASLGVNGLLDLLTAGDLNPALRAEFPAAARSALKGDRQPLLRLSARAAGLDNGSGGGDARRPIALQSEDTEFGDGSLYLATLCEENPTFPWTRGASITQRQRELRAAVAAAPAGSFGLFPAAVGLGGFGETCMGWNVATPAPPVAGALPDVPVLLLAGSADLRTPLEDARALAPRLPQAQLVAVPDTGHSVLTSESGTCGKDAVGAFLRGAPVPACKTEANPFAPTGRIPQTLGDVSKARSLPSKPGRTLNVLPAALADIRRQIIGDLIAVGQAPEAVGGLRGGSVRVRSARRWQLRRYELVRGVQISGTYVENGTSTFTFSGSNAAAGTVRVSKSGRATGRLGGSRVNVTPRASAASVDQALPTWEEALRLGQARAGA